MEEDWRRAASVMLAWSPSANTQDEDVEAPEGDGSENMMDIPNTPNTHTEQRERNEVCEGID